MSPDALLATCIIIIAFFCESLFGFGGGLISIPLLSILFGVKDAVTLVLIFQLLMGVLLFSTYKHTKWKLALPMTVGLLIGTFIGTYSLLLLDNGLLRQLLGISIMLFLIKSIFLKGFTFGKQQWWGSVAGLVGGWFQGIIGTGGPILTMYVSVILPKKHEFRAMLIYLFFITSVVRIVTSASTGLLTEKVLSVALPVVPVFFLAIYIGNRVHTKINDKYYRYAVNIILLFAAISLLIKK